MTTDNASPPARSTTAVGRTTAHPSPMDWAAHLSEDWAPTVGRILLGLVLAWFGYHELIQPSLWTGYVPVVSGSLAVVLVLAHGWLLLMLAVALFAGIAVRVAAALTAALLLEIEGWLTISSGLSDLVLRDLGVLGLALSLTATTRQRLTVNS